MATLNAAVQSLVDNLHTKMITPGSELTPEEQTLVANAISSLGDNVSWEQALVAVATEHLNTATAALETATASSVSDIGSAEAALIQSTADSVAAIQTAEASLLTKSSQLDIAASVPEALAASQKNRDGNIGNIDEIMSSVPNKWVMTTPDFSSQTPGFNAIFCSDGEVRIHLLPTSLTSGTSGTLNYYHGFYKIDAGSDHNEQAFSRHEYCYVSNGTVRGNYANRYAHWANMCELPLANSTDPEDISFQQLISDYSSATENASTFRGISLFNNVNYTVLGGHFHNEVVVDKYGLRSPALTSGYHGQSSSHAVLYDNNRNCAVVIEDGKVWFLYSDGWIDPAIATFGDNTQAQTWVDSQDLQVIMMRSYGTPEVYHPFKYENDINKSTTDVDNSFTSISSNLQGKLLSPTADSWAYNYQDEVSTNYRTSLLGTKVASVTGTGANSGWKASQQYLWDVTTKTLTKCYRESIMEVIPPINPAYSASATYPWVTIKERVWVTNLDTNEILDDAQFRYLTKSSGTWNGIREADLPMYNPYGNNWYNSVNKRNNNTYNSSLERYTKVTQQANDRLGRA